MIRWNGFRRSLAFAAVAAAGAMPFLAVAAPALGRVDALAAWAVLSAAGYLVGLGGGVRRGIGAALLAVAVASILSLLTPTLPGAVLGAALALGLCRSGLLYQSRFARALVLESLLMLGAVGLAGHLYSGTLYSAALATWAFFLVQSAFFLAGGVALRREPTAEGDPFELARARALEVLEHGGMGEP